MPELFLKNVWANVNKEWKIAWISTFVIGLLTHLYVMTNTLPNHDGLVNIYHSQMKFSSGRFFLGPFSGISSYFDLPWINGLLSIIYLALMTVLLVEIFQFKKTVTIILTSAVIVTFPTVGATFSYMFTADGYMMGNLLATLAVYITKKWRYGFIPASLIFYMSVGIYQANLPLFLVIATILFIQWILTLSESPLNLIRKIIPFVLTSGIGMALYAITFKLYQNVFNGAISDYQGLTEIGSTSEPLLAKLLKIKDSAIDFYFQGLFGSTPVNLWEVLNVLFFLIVFAGFVITLFAKWKTLGVIKVLLLAIALLCLPFFVYILYFVSPDVSYHMLMVMALSVIYLLPLILYEQFTRVGLSVKIISWATVILLSLMTFNFALVDNITYFNMNSKYEKSSALSLRIVDRIEQTDGFENASRITVIGRPKMFSHLGSVIVPSSIPTMTGALGEHILSQPYDFEFMIQNQFGLTFKRLTPEEHRTLLETESVQEMGNWPASDAVVIQGDTVIIKFE